MRIHGLIPAHAGKTPGAANEWSRRGAHPRSRGENFPLGSAWLDPGGSSPLTRGKRDMLWQQAGRTGLIPAHAGKTLPHPRHCHADRGSSPLTRGKHGPARRVPRRRRLIPAHAGKTVWRRHPRRAAPAHPRSRGENGVGGSSPRLSPGSSPLTRGKREPRLQGRVPAGLIPAHAGKTHVSGAVLRHIGAHPRSRGENTTMGRLAQSAQGSSPLTRGKHDLLRHIPDDARLIPAHAGKTRNVAAAHQRGRAHPRSRGENLALVQINGAGKGSSPLTRGKQMARAAGNVNAGLIPAHAGKTDARQPR